MEKMKRPGKTGRSGKIFRRFLVSYLLLLLIPLLLFAFILKSTTSSMERSAKQSNLVLLKQAQGMIDSRMKNVYQAIIGLNYNSAVNSVLRSQDSFSENLDLVRGSFKDLSAFDQGGEQVYVYASRQDLLLSSKGCYSYLDKIYGNILAYDGMAYPEFREKILRGRFGNRFMPAAPAVVDSQPGRWILYLQSIPLGVERNVLGNILYFIREDSILQYMDGLRINDGGWACVITPDNTILTGVGEAPADPAALIGPDSEGFIECALDGREMILAYTRSDYNHWIYLAAVPRSVALHEANAIRLTVYLLFGVYMLFGVGISCLFAVKNFRPLKEVFTLIRQPNGESRRDADEYQLLKEYVETLERDNRRLSRSLDGYSPMIESALVSRLIRGEFNTPGEIDDFTGGRHPAADHALYCAAVVDFYPRLNAIDESVLNELLVRRVVVRETLAELSDDTLLYSGVDVHRIGLLFYSDAAGEAELLAHVRAQLSELSARMFRRYGSGIYIGAGTCCASSLQANFSYLQASEALGTAVRTEQPLLFYDARPASGDGGYLPDSLSLSLAQAVEDGNLKQAKNILKILDVENFQRRTPGEAGARELLEGLRRLLTRFQDGELPPDPFAGEAADVHDRFYFYSHALLAVCNRTSDAQYNRNKKIHTDILQFIDANYNNNNLCLAMVAARFGLSEPYVSHLLKKSMGVNFSTYLEARRMEEAKKLLSQGGCSIEAVASRVGYNSPHTFRRAFKKVTGANPSDLKSGRGPKG